MLAIACAIAMLVFALLGWIAMRRAPPHTSRFCPEVGAREVSIFFGAAIGMLGGSIGGTPTAWIANGGIASIPIGAAAVGLGWQLLRSDEPIREPSLISAGVLLVAWGILSAAMLSGGLGLSEGAAILLALAAWSWFQSGVDRSRGKVPRPGGAFVGAFVGLAICGWIGLSVGLDPRIVWGLALVGILFQIVTWGAADRTRDVRPFLAVAILTPLTALGTASVIRVVTLAVLGGTEARRYGSRWIVGVAETLASQPVATVPGGFAPEVCLAGAILGAGLCASKLPREAQRLLGVLIGLAGVGLIALAMAS